MATGACGINCDVCALNLKGICSTCGPATGDIAARKLAAQRRIMGAPCSILACAQLNRIDHCMRDCDSFPCDNFTAGPYPFSEAYLNMQQRRKTDPVAAYADDGSHLEIDTIYWDEIRSRNLTDLCNWTFFEAVDDACLQFVFLNDPVRIDLAQQCLFRQCDGQWQPLPDPLLTLATVMYLKNVAGVYPMGKDIVGRNDLKEGHFFTGPHEFRTEGLLTRFSDDIEGFLSAGKRLGGRPMEMGDAGMALFPFPRIPIYFLLWRGDEEFKPRLQVLFDRPIEESLAADAIWALVNRVAMAFAAV